MAATKSAERAEPFASSRWLSALTIALGVAFPVFILWLFNESNPFTKPYPIPQLFPHNHIVEVCCLAAGAFDAAGILVCWLHVLGVIHSKPHRLAGQVVTAAAAFSFLILVRQFVPEVALHDGFLAPRHIKMSAGWPVMFVNPLGGTTHVVCLGTDGVCRTGGAIPPPPELRNGLRLLPGETVRVMFEDVEDYPITVEASPTMNMLIQTAPPPENDDFGD